MSTIGFKLSKNYANTFNLILSVVCAMTLNNCFVCFYLFTYLFILFTYLFHYIVIITFVRFCAGWQELSGVPEEQHNATQSQEGSVNVQRRDSPCLH